MKVTSVSPQQWAIARSGLPSPFMSATAMAAGPNSVLISDVAWNVPLPLASSTPTSNPKLVEKFRFWVVTSRSGTLSPLTSAAIMKVGYSPAE